MNLSWTDFAATLDQTFMGITLGRLALSLGILLLTFIAKKVVNHLFRHTLPRFTRKSSSQSDDLLLTLTRRPAEFFVFVLGLDAATRILQLPKEPVDLRSFAESLIATLFTLTIAWLLFNLVTLLEHGLLRLTRKTESKLDDNLVPFVRKALRAFIVLISLLMLMQNMGYSISGILASLGIGGLAVALAAKDTLANIFGSMMILVDRPFHLGDWIKAGEMEGIVEEVGFRSTKIRTFAKTLITVPNSVLCNLAIDNYSRMPKRRIKLIVGVTYSTTPQQMREAVEAIRQMLAEHPAINQDFWLVNFDQFGASSLDIMVYCFTNTTTWGEYLDAKQDVCLRIMELLEERGLEIAFPSRTVYLKDENEGSSPEATDTDTDAATAFSAKDN